MGNKVKAKCLVVAVCALILTVCAVAAGGLMLIDRIEDDAARENVARRLGVKPDWDTIKHQTYCVFLAPGATRREAEQRLHMIDGFFARAGSRIASYTFYDGYVARHLSTIYVAFDDNGRIADRWLIELSGVSDTNRVEIDCAKLQVISGK